MTEQENRRRIRGRVRRQRVARRRKQIAGFGIIGLVGLAVVSSISFNVIKRERVRVLEPQAQRYQFDPNAIVIGQTEVPEAKKKSGGSGLLNLDRLFPQWSRNRKPQQIAQNEQTETEKKKEPQGEVTILDDLRAAPPKTIYLEAIFQPSTYANRDPLPEIELSVDFTGDPFGGGTSGPLNPAPVIPEPSTGVLLGVGLVGIAAARRRRTQRHRREEA